MSNKKIKKKERRKPFWAQFRAGDRIVLRGDDNLNLKITQNVLSCGSSRTLIFGQSAYGKQGHKVLGLQHPMHGKEMIKSIKEGIWTSYVAKGLYLYKYGDAHRTWVKEKGGYYQSLADIVKVYDQCDSLIWQEGMHEFIRYNLADMIDDIVLNLEKMKF